MKQVHIVVGTSGEYSDRTEWIAGVYLTREEAIAVAERELSANRAKNQEMDEILARAERAKEGFSIEYPIEEFRYTRFDSISFENKRRVNDRVEELAKDMGWEQIEWVNDYTVISTQIGEFGHFGSDTKGERD